jgi:hypothetical protein
MWEDGSIFVVFPLTYAFVLGGLLGYDFWRMLH